MAMSKHSELKSSNIKSTAYDPATAELEVTFTNGGTYRYANVAAHHYETLMTHDSPGSYFHQRIRSSHAVKKVSP